MVQQARTDLNIATVGQISCVTPVQKLGAKTVESSTSSTSSTPKNVNTQKTKECYPQGGYPPLKNTKESTDTVTILNKIAWTVTITLQMKKSLRVCSIL